MNIKILLKLFRPSTLVAPAVGGLLMSLLAIHTADIHITYYILLKIAIVLSMLAMANAAGNIINHVVDSYDTDIYNPAKRNRPIASGQVDRLVAISMAVYIFGFTLILSYALFPLLPALIMTVILFLSWAYSAPPRFKKYYILSNLSIGTPRGSLGVLVAYSFFAYPDIKVMVFSFILGVFVFGVNTTKDLGDEDPDRKAGIRNFVTVLGGERAKRYIIIPFLYIPFGIWAIYLIIMPYWQGLLLFLALVFSIWIHISLKRPDNGKMENNSTWYLFYAEMAFIIALFTIPLL